MRRELEWKTPRCPWRVHPISPNASHAAPVEGLEIGRTDGRVRAVHLRVPVAAGPPRRVSTNLLYPAPSGTHPVGRTGAAFAGAALAKGKDSEHVHSAVTLSVGA